MGSQNSAPVSPVGAVWREFRDNYPNTNLYASDGSHPNINGSYLTACTFYASIYHKNPIGAWKPTAIDSTLALAIQTQVNTTVFDSLNVWGIDTVLPPHNVTYFQTATTQSQVDFAFFASDSLVLDSVTWSFGNGNSASGFSVINSYFNNGTYTVISHHWQGCAESIDTNEVYVFPWSVFESASSFFKIYPNPSLDRISVQTELNGKIDYSIFTTTGQNILSGTLQNEEINLSALSEGLYILLLKVDSKLYRQKLIKQ